MRKGAAPSSSSERGAERELGANRTGLSVVKNWNNKAEQEADFKSQSCLQVSFPHLRGFHFHLLDFFGLASHFSAECSYCFLIRLLETVNYQ